MQFPDRLITARGQIVWIVLLVATSALVLRLEATSPSPPPEASNWAEKTD